MVRVVLVGLSHWGYTRALLCNGSDCRRSVADPSSWPLGRHPSPCDGRRLLGGEYDPRSQALAQSGFEQQDVVGWLRLVIGRILTRPLRATRNRIWCEIGRTYPTPGLRPRRRGVVSTAAWQRHEAHSDLRMRRPWGEIILEGVVARGWWFGTVVLPMIRRMHEPSHPRCRSVLPRDHGCCKGRSRSSWTIDRPR